MSPTELAALIASLEENARLCDLFVSWRKKGDWCSVKARYLEAFAKSFRDIRAALLPAKEGT